MSTIYMGAIILQLRSLGSHSGNLFLKIRGEHGQIITNVSDRTDRVTNQQLLSFTVTRENQQYDYSLFQTTLCPLCCQALEGHQDHKIHTVEQDEKQAFHAGADISASTTTIGLVNGMISGAGICVVLPQLGLQAGWLTTLWVCILTGFISYYTAKLIVIHLGKGSQIQDCILAHFKQDYRYMAGYGGFIWFNFIVQLVIYFRIICLQIEGLLGYTSNWVGPLVAVLLFFAILGVRIYHIGQEILAYGIVSIVTYLLFIMWAMFTAPAGSNTVPVSGPPVTLISSLMMGYSIHDFLVQNLIKNPRRYQYQGVVKSTFLLGTIAYAYMTFGSFAIANRHPFVHNPQIINDFFKQGMWQMVILEIVMVLQMGSVFPLFMIVSKIRFFQMLGIEVHKKTNMREIIYVLVFVLVSYLVYISGINLQALISFNGAVVGYSYVIVIPIWIHLKCVWYDRSSGYVEDDQEHNALVQPNICECEHNYSSKWWLYFETLFLVSILVAGLVLVIFTMYGFFAPSSTHA